VCFWLKQRGFDSRKPQDFCATRYPVLASVLNDHDFQLKFEQVEISRERISDSEIEHS
jgi:hypothetical protein